MASKTQQRLSRKIRKLRKEGVPQKQAVAQAHSMLGIKKKKKK